MKKLPLYSYIPGVNPRPDFEEPIAEKMNRHSPEQSECFQRGLELFRAEYYWESHVYFEALWKAHHREGTIADFLKALIKLSAAGVNFRQSQWDRAKDQLKRAEEILLEVQRREGDSFLGMDLMKIIRSLKEMPASPQQVAGTFCRIL